MATAAPTVAPPVLDRTRPGVVAAWLLAVAGIVLVMIVVGGITRLTESGLSIVRWDPVGGIVPPLSAADWAREYAAYRTSPQGLLVNADMGLAAFKGIFFWEWLHRVIARVFVAVLVVPMAWFAARRMIPVGFGGRVLILLGLGAAEPVVGWWMVASGLVNRPSVAPERLAFHLGVAFTILAVSLWTALDLLPSPEGRGRGWGVGSSGNIGTEPRTPTPNPSRPGRGVSAAWIVPLFALLAVQILWGALTAGLRAGHAAATWPLMGDRFVPALGSIVADPVSVQFVHRTLAYVVAAAVAAVAVVSMYRAGAGRRAIALGGLVALQFVLGVLTIVNGVPVPLAAAHQATAALLLAATVWTAQWALAFRR